MPLGRVAGVTVGGPATIRVRFCGGEVIDGVLLSCTVTVNGNVPLAVGVPLMIPVEAFNIRPAGSAPEATVQLLYGGVPPLAPNV